MGLKRKQNTKQEAPPKIEQEEIIEEKVPELLPEEIEEHDRVDREYFDTMPMGYRFVPTEEELISGYLNNKIISGFQSLPINRIRDINIYDYSPQNLTSVYKLHRGRDWYFFTPRLKKYPNGLRPDRAAGNGFWKATGADVSICNDQGIKIGTKKTLVYYMGKAKENNGIKTDWIMHEYRNQVDNTNNVGAVNKNAMDMQLDEWVLCKIYNKSSKEEEEDLDRELELEDLNLEVDGNNRRNQLAYQNPNRETFPMENVLQVSNPTRNQGRNGASACSSFVSNQNIGQRLDVGTSYNMLCMPSQYVQVPNPNISLGRDGRHFCNMASNYPTQNVQAQNSGITHSLENARLHNRARLPVHNVEISGSNTNQYPYDVDFSCLGSLPIQNDGFDLANDSYNMDSFMWSDYDQTGTLFGYLGDNNVNNQQVVSPDDPLQILQAQNQYQIFPQVISPDIFDDKSYGIHAHSQEALLDYPPPLDFSIEVPFDSKDGEVQGADQELSSREKKKG